VGAPFFAVSCTVRLIQTKKDGRRSQSHVRVDFALTLIRNDGGDAPHHHMFLSGKKSAAGTVPNMLLVWEKNYSCSRVLVSVHYPCASRRPWGLKRGRRDHWGALCTVARAFSPPVIPSPCQKK